MTSCCPAITGWGKSYVFPTYNSFQLLEKLYFDRGHTSVPTTVILITLQSFDGFYGLVFTGFTCCPVARHWALKILSSSFNEILTQIILWNLPRLMLELF